MPPPQSSSRTLDWILLLVPGVIWGASFLFIAEALSAIEPKGLTFLRIVIGFLTLSCFPAVRRPVLRKDWPAIFGLGFIWLAFPLNLVPYAEQRVSSALTGMLNGANPLFTSIVAAIITRQAPPRLAIWGVLTGLIGTILIALPALGEGSSSTAGVILALSSVACYGVSLNVARPLQQRNGALPVIWRAQAVAILLTAPFGLPDLPNAHWNWPAALSLLALGALGTGAAYAVLGHAAGRLGSTRASATTFLIPPVSLLLGVLVRGEHVAPISVTGCFVCIAGAWLLRRATAH